MDATTFNRLEFPAVLQRLSALAQSPAARGQILETEPWIDPGEIARHWDAVEELLGVLDSGATLPINGFDDCEELLARLRMPNGMLEGSEWLQIRHFVTIGSSVRRQAQDGRARMPVVWREAQTIEPFEFLLERLARTFDPEGNVRDSASDELRACRSRIRRLEKDIERIFERILSKFRDKDVLQESYWTERSGRRVVPVRSGSRGKLPGIVHDTSNTGGTLFVEPFEIIEPTNLLAEERTAERTEIVRVLSHLAQAARSDLPSLQRNRETLVQIDLWNARATLAHRHDLHRPQIGQGFILDLVETHHPLLYLNDPKTSVPFSVRLKGENRALVVTGPNTGGKTTALKTIALTALMAQSAIPVPLGVDSRLPIFRHVLAEVGDDQSVSAGLSTFSAHIRRVSWILEHCGTNALVLLDELGKATDPLQAGALGRAIIEALIDRGALVFITTHLGTLKDWAQEHPAGRNASYRLDPTTHRPLYKIHLDTPGISEAFTIARAEGLPKEIVQAAIEQLPKEERDLTELLDTLHEKESKLEEEARNARATRLRADREIERLKKDRANMSKLKLDADKNLEEKYKGLLDKARVDLEKRIAKLPSREALSQARSDIQGDQREAEARIEALRARERSILDSSKSPETPDAPPYEAAVGDWVFVGKGTQAGQIEKISANRKRAVIAMGGLQMKAPTKDLKRAEPPEEESSEQRFSRMRYTSGVAAQTLQPEINLVGQRVEEALENLDKYLDQAILAHLKKIRVVHGHGTGALRSAVQKCLAHHPLVASHRIADVRDGGQAVTFAKLK